MRSKIIRAVSVILLLAVMAAVFGFSEQPADESQATSDGFLYRLMSVFYPEIKTMTNEQREELMEKFSSPVRKCAHFSIYGLMGVFSLLSFISYKTFKIDMRCAAAWLLCIAYSVGDEIHQHFIPGRSCELRDMIIDSSGALLGIAAAYCLCALIKKKRSKANED